MSQKLISDTALVKQYMAGENNALSELISRHRDKVYTSIYMFVKEDALAEDIFQDTFIKVIDTLRKGKYYEDGKFLPWVMRIAYNLCIDHYRKVKRTPNFANSEDFDIFNVLKYNEDNAEEKMIKNQTYAKVRALIDELPAEQKEVVILRHYAEMSFKEISKLTDVSINTALGRMRYALINMRKLIVDNAIPVR